MDLTARKNVPVTLIVTGRQTIEIFVPIHQEVKMSMGTAVLKVSGMIIKILMAMECQTIGIIAQILLLMK
jgi:hypothetical protein